MRYLVALDALLELRSVSLAAERLHTSQPAMSRSLAAIRRATGDAILVREGHRMVPTPYAEQVREEVRELVDRGRTVLTPPSSTDPSRLTDAFSLRVNDALAAAVLPTIYAEFARQAPGATLRILAEPTSDAERVAESADAWLGETTRRGADRTAADLGSTPIVVIGATTTIPADGFALDDFARLRHVVVSRRGRTRDRIDTALEAAGLRRHVAMTTPSMATALGVVARDPSTVTVAPALCAHVPPALTGTLATAPLPFDTPPVHASLSWPRRLHRDPAQRWFRGLIVRVVRELLSPDPER